MNGSKDLVQPSLHHIISKTVTGFPLNLSIKPNNMNRYWIPSCSYVKGLFLGVSDHFTCRYNQSRWRWKVVSYGPFDLKQMESKSPASAFTVFVAWRECTWAFLAYKSIPVNIECSQGLQIQYYFKPQLKMKEVCRTLCKPAIDYPLQTYILIL